MSFSPLRTVFFGTPEFAVPPLQALIDSEVADVVALVCQPDKPKGRGQRVTAPPTKVLAEEKGIPVLQPEKLRGTDFQAKFASLRPDAGIVAAYGKILPRDVLETPKHGCINIHGSLLPRLRGAAPIQWALINGDHETGITIMQMDEGCDTGPIIAQERCEILEDDDAVSLGHMLCMIGAKMIVKVLEGIARDGEVKCTPQENDAATQARLLRKEDGVLDWSQPALKIVGRIRGVTPWPGAQAAVNGTAMKIVQAEPIPAHHPNAKPGKIVEVDPRRGFVVATGDGFLLIQRVQPAGKAVMTASDAVNGGFVKEGATLSTTTRGEATHRHQTK
jgi:methionyl-tRNA formyltransferase